MLLWRVKPGLLDTSSHCTMATVNFCRYSLKVHFHRVHPCGSSTTNFYSRYLFAAGRNKHMPRFFCMLHVRFFTPLHAISVTVRFSRRIIAIGMLCCMEPGIHNFLLFEQAGAAIVYSLIPNIQSLIAYSSLAVQLKILLAMTAFFYLRWKEPHLERPVKVRSHLGWWTAVVKSVQTHRVRKGTAQN